MGLGVKLLDTNNLSIFLIHLPSRRFFCDYSALRFNALMLVSTQLYNFSVQIPHKTQVFTEMTIQQVDIPSACCGEINSPLKSQHNL